MKFLLFLLSIHAFGTSIMRDYHSLAREYCEVEGTFKEPRFIETPMGDGTEYRVIWVLQVTSAKAFNSDCPSLGEVPMAIREAQYDPKRLKYVYPVHIKEPLKGAKLEVKLSKVMVSNPHLREQYTEWLVTDWSEGFRLAL